MPLGMPWQLQERLRYCDSRTTRRLWRVLQLSRMIWVTCCILLIKAFGFVLATVLTDSNHFCKFMAKNHIKKSWVGWWANSCHPLPSPSPGHQLPSAPDVTVGALARHHPPEFMTDLQTSSPTGFQYDNFTIVPAAAQKSQRSWIHSRIF